MGLKDRAEAAQDAKAKAEEPQALPEPFPSQRAVDQFLLDDGGFFVQQSVLNPHSVPGV